MLFDGRNAGELAALGETRAPSVADLFVAHDAAGRAGQPSSKEAA